MNLIRSLTFLALLSALSTATQAQISVDRAVIDFRGETSSETLVVSNTGKTPTYVTTEINEILNPHVESPTEKKYDDPRTAPLLAHPQVLLLQPGERKTMQIFLREKATRQDRVFKLTVKPYYDNVVLNRSTTNEKSSAIKISVGYRLLVVSRPENSSSNVNVKRNGKNITFTNSGNTNALLKDIEQCNTATGECESLGTNRLYAGETFTTSLPWNGSAGDYPVRARIISVDTHEVRTY